MHCYFKWPTMSAISSRSACETQVRLEEQAGRLWRRVQALRAAQLERQVLSGATPEKLERLLATQAALDSDHTASSSGGESGEEERECYNPAQHSHEWHWAEQRAGLGSRWAWLQAQVSELEFRIRGLSDLYSQLRQAKDRGAQHLASNHPLTQTPSQIFHSQDGTLYSQDPLRKKLPNDSVVFATPTSAARVRALPYCRRRHKLLRLGGSIPPTAKAQCWCEPPLSCVVCAGTLYTSPFDTALPVRTRAGRLDMCLHPILSLPSDVHLDLQCGALLRSVPHHCSTARATANPPHAHWQARRATVLHNLSRPRRKAALGHMRNAPGPTGERIGRSFVAQCVPSQHIRSPELRLYCPTTPAPQPTKPVRRRHRENSLDINNLVMPVVLARLWGGVRAQRLQYKEILTPSWRQLDPTGPSAAHPAESGVSHRFGKLDEEEEDLSDVAFLRRHAPWESREKGRWGRGAHRRRSHYRGRGTLPPFRQDISQTLNCESWPSRPGVMARGRVEEFLDGVNPPKVLSWERRLFPLSEKELLRLEVEEEEGSPCEPQADFSSTSARSQSTDSGISVESLDLSPMSPFTAQATIQKR